MGYGSSVYKAAAELLARRRADAERAAEQRREEIYEKLPRVKEIEEEISKTGLKAARAVLGGGDVTQQMNVLKKTNLELQSELKSLLINNGFAEDSLEPDYTCKKCSDAGYRELDNRTVVCDCLKKAQIACACDELNNSAPLALSTFDSFSADLYDDLPDEKTGLVPRAHMTKILRYCKAYAANFTPQSESILMRGATGLGKTHLSLAIANDVIKRGYGVIYTSAPVLVNRLETMHFSHRQLEEYELFNSLCACDLLIIDDLGTEMRSGYSSTQLYNLFNSRVLSHKPVIISTNLNMRQLEDYYSDRFVSRINGTAQKLDFVGRDNRIKRK